MKKDLLKSTFYCFIIALLSSCQKEEDDKPTLSPALVVTVTDESGQTVGNVVVAIYKDPTIVTSGTADFTATTDSSGVAKFFDKLEGKYYVSAGKGDQKSKFKGLVEDGIFDSEAEINESAWQTGAKVGGVKYKDLNGDMLINSLDETFMNFVEVTPSVPATYSIKIFPEDPCYSSKFEGTYVGKTSCDDSEVMTTYVKTKPGEPCKIFIKNSVDGPEIYGLLSGNSFTIPAQSLEKEGDTWTWSGNGEFSGKDISFNFHLLLQEEGLEPYEAECTITGTK